MQARASRSIEEIKLVFELKISPVDVMVVSWPVDFLPS